MIEIIKNIIIIGSFLAFLILIGGVFLVLHQNEIQILYPMTLLKQKMFRRPLITGFFLNVFFGLYIMNFIPLKFIGGDFYF